MTTARTQIGRSRLLPAGVACVVGAAMAAGLATDATWERPGWFLAALGGAAFLAMVVSTGVVALADRNDTAEHGLLGSVVLSVSVMAAVEALLAPQLIFDSTDGFRAASGSMMPIAASLGAPLIFRGSLPGRWAVSRWRGWTLVGLSLVFVVGSVVAIAPAAIVLLVDATPVRFALAVTSSCVFVAMAAMRRRLAVAVPFTLFAAGALAPLSSSYGVAFWLAHSMTAVGLVGASLGLARTSRLSRMQRAVRTVFAPVLEREPLLALDLDASPTVRRLLGNADGNDAHHHAVRSAELALKVGERCGLSAPELRDLGLAALLHDAGKSDGARRVLSKAGRLTDEELTTVRMHPVDGALVLAAEPFLASVAPLVRSHHERVDGRGYPDGLAGDDIPLAARIIAVCHAFGALTRDRPYRRAFPLPIAIGILREHAGAQWDARVVDHLIAVLPSVWSDRDDHGAEAEAPLDVSVPDDIAELLVSVDVEI